MEEERLSERDAVDRIVQIVALEQLHLVTEKNISYKLLDAGVVIQQKPRIWCRNVSSSLQNGNFLKLLGFLVFKLAQQIFTKVLLGGRFWKPTCSCCDLGVLASLLCWDSNLCPSCSCKINWSLKFYDIYVEAGKYG